MTLDSCFKKFPILLEFQVYIDGSNVAYFNFSKNNKPLLSNIVNLISHLIELGFIKENIFCICDPSLRFYIDKPLEFKSFIKEGLIFEAPKIADEIILSFAIKKKYCFIVSNDKFRDYIDQLPNSHWLEERSISFMIIGDSVCLSPNIDFIKLDNLFSDKSKPNKQDDEITTLSVLEIIERGGTKLNYY